MLFAPAQAPLADTHETKEAKEIERHAREIEKLLDDHLRSVVLQTLERTPVSKEGSTPGGQESPTRRP